MAFKFARSDLQSQVGFNHLSVPELQPFLCVQDSFGYTAVSNKCGPSNSVTATKLDKNAYAPINSICPEVYALLTAAEASITHRADGGMDRNAYGRGSRSLSALDGTYDPERVLRRAAPPKRFYGRLWKSISMRLLERQANS